MAPAELVDLHCHLDLYPDFVDLIRRCDEARIFTLTVTTTPKAWARNFELTRGTKFVRAALGLHPQLVASRAAEITLWEELLPQTRYVGEVGLDASPRYYKSLDAQKTIFARVLTRCAAVGDKILTVHSLRAAKAVLDLIEAHLPPSRGRVVLHWFTGTPAEARRAVDLGCFFSVNAQMLAHEKGTKLVSAIPRNRLLTETDGPFTTVDGRPASPSDVAICVRKLAKLLGEDDGVTRGTVFTNLRELLS